MRWVSPSTSGRSTNEGVSMRKTVLIRSPTMIRRKFAIKGEHFFRLIRNRRESKHGKHAAGLSFFGAIGIVLVQVAGGADAGIMDLFDAERAALPDNFSREVDFVVRRTNSGTELHDHVRGTGAEAINHFVNGVGDDAELGAF